MGMVESIEKKKRGGALDRAEIHSWIRGVTDGSVPDYQSSALLMAIWFRGLDREETIALTEEMIHSGDVLDLGSVRGVTADKHSTGGVGDKLSFIIGPLAAASGVPVPMLSGRALGHTGGTLDKLESIPGYQTRLSTERFIEIVRDVGLSIVGQTERLAPADGKLYSLRDVTGTVDAIPLIVSSILSKKHAAGPHALVFDVKCGDGAILRTREDSRRLAELLVDVSSRLGKPSTAILTEMDVPLGRTVGNALEIAESIESLRGEGAPDMMEISRALAAEMLLLTGVAGGEEEALARIDRVHRSGEALRVFQRMIEAHGGDAKVVDDTTRLPKAAHAREVAAPAAGFVAALPARAIGLAAMRLGAGRETVEDPVSPGAGIELIKKPGDRVAKGEPLARLHADREDRIIEVIPRVLDAYRIAEEPPAERPRILERIRSDRGG
ncbi:MAG: thymidine phosphorylase [Candidatus Eisenbacteria bacterium]|nr:thymidine phosphorylase [Candidatus Eisenbacteria bacterium]